MTTTEPIAVFSVQGTTSSTSMKIIPGRPLFVVGGNGTGKSALVHHVVGQLGGVRTIYLPGSRSNSFDQESLTMTPAARRQFEINAQHWDRAWEGRWRNLSGTARNERAIHDLQNAETQYVVDATTDIKSNGQAAQSIALLQANSSPVDIINRIMAEANVPPRLLIIKGELRAVKSGSDYSIAKMSDGERAALTLVCDVISAAPSTVFILDEPELHMHRGIVLPLLSTLFRRRTDCAFVVSTHELALPDEWTDSDTIIVRGCTWAGEQPHSWDIDLLSSGSPIPDDVRLDVLGSRKKIVFVEGRTTSLDRPLYSLLFPNATIRERGSSRDVKNAVAGLRADSSSHHIEAYGIIDNDGLSPLQIQELESVYVFPLPVFSIESLYYCREIQDAVAEQMRSLGRNPDELIERAKRRALESIKPSNLIHLAARLSEQKIHNLALSQLPDRDMIAEGDGLITLSVISPYSDELAHISKLLSEGDIDAIVGRYSVRHSGVLPAIAEGIGFEDCAKYELAALARIGADAELRSKMQERLGPLARLLA